MRIREWLRNIYYYCEGQVKLNLLRLSWKHRQELKIRTALIGRSLDICKYLGKRQDNDWITYSNEYEEDGEKRKLFVAVNETTEDGLPNVILRLIQEIDGERVTISRFSPSDMDTLISPKSKQILISLGIDCDLDPSLVCKKFIMHYLERQKEVEKSPGYFFDQHLRELKSSFPSIGCIDPSSHPELNIPLEELVALETRLQEIAGSEEVPGVRLYKIKKAVAEVYRKYEDGRAGRAAEERRRQEEAGMPELQRVKYGFSRRPIRRDVEVIIEEDSSAISQSLVRALPAPQSISNFKNGAPTTGISGYRRDIGFNARSSWEANYARILMFQGLKFKYQPQTFQLQVPEDMRHLFDGRETVNYIPDFQIEGTNRFVEIKGEWFNYNGQQTMAKMILFKRQHPEFELEAIDVIGYRRLEKEYKSKINSFPQFCGWESGGRKSGHNLATHPQDFL